MSWLKQRAQSLQLAAKTNSDLQIVINQNENHVDKAQVSLHLVHFILLFFFFFCKSKAN